MGFIERRNNRPRFRIQRPESAIEAKMEDIRSHRCYLQKQGVYGDELIEMMYRFAHTFLGQRSKL